MRKECWNQLLVDWPEIAKVLKSNVLMDYLMNIRSKVNLAKKKLINKFQNRNDHQTFMYTEPKELNPLV